MLEEEHEEQPQSDNGSFWKVRVRSAQKFPRVIPAKKKKSCQMWQSAGV